MSISKKDTIYIDIDDEITSVIEKVQDSHSKILALVLPKRAAVLQSTVNMRLLKRAAEESGKNVVLITSEAALLPLAGVVGVYVARTLQTKPAIPVAPDIDESHITITDDVDSSEIQDYEEVDPKTPIGVLAGKDMPEDDETIEVDYEEDATPKNDQPATPKDKKLKIPDFDKFRNLFLLGGALLAVLISGGVWAFMIAPKALITVKTDSTALSSTLTFTASPSAKNLDKEKMIVPATSKESKKTNTQKVPATGEKDNGNKATGTMTVFYCPNNNNAQTSLPAGSAFISNGTVFRTSAAATVPASNFTGGGVCKKDLSQNVAVVSDLAGDKYNLSSRGYTNVDNSSISGTGSAMSGGTSKIIKVVSQSDIDSAKQQMIDRTKVAAITDLTKQFKDENMLPLNDSVTIALQTASASPNVNEEASETTVGLTITFSMLGLSNSDLKQLVDINIKDKIDIEKEQVSESDYGLNSATVKLQEKKANGDIQTELQTQLSIGPKLDIEGIKKEIAGKKKGDVLSLIGTRPGVKDVHIQYSPFWVTATPSNKSKITIVLEKSDGSK